MTDNGICVICNGKKIFLNHPCTFCNGTGQWNQVSENYLKDHICQCIIWGRKFCPVCNEKCHHNTSSSPKQKIDPGYGGMTSTMQLDSSITNFETQEEELIIA